MPAFDVTVNPTTLEAKAGEKQSVVVTVTNKLGRPVTARASAVVDPANASAWIKAPPDAQRAFSQAATLDFQFGIEVPAAGPAGLYKVRIDVVDIEQPDENFGQSAMIALTVPKPAVVPPPNGRGKFPWWVWLVAALVVVGVGFGIWKAFFSSKAPPPPTLLGPAGGDGGEEFSDLCDNVVAVHVREGYFIDAIQLICLDPNGTPISNPRRGGPGGGESIFELQVGEHITAVSGSAMGPGAPFVFSVQFQTDRRSSPVYGNHGPTPGQVPFTFSVPPGGRFRGLFGRSGQYLVALGALVYQSP
jgi:hypothetical protein